MSEVPFLVKIRDGAQMIADATNEYLEKLAPKDETKEAVKEENFGVLKFEEQKGNRLGVFEVAHRNSNIPENFDRAFNILKQANTTINNRYHGADYIFSYWLYGEGKIYRQKRKASQN